MTAEKQPADETPHLGSLRAGPALAGALYLLLVGSAALALAARRFPEKLPPGLGAAAPWLFLAFLVVFTLYRVAGVQAKKYQAGKAFFQVGSAALFFMLLLPYAKPASEAPADPLLSLLAEDNAHVRALAAEVARYRPEGVKYAPRLVDALSDPDETVRREAHRSLVQLTGADLGEAGDAAVKAWRARYP
jgi:hypothetical protein